MTRKEILNRFDYVYSVGYCDLQFLLRYQNKIGSNAGVYGWNYNVYGLDNNTVAICTGYRSMPGKRIDSTIIKKYEEKARKITYDYSLKWEEQKKKINKLLDKFIIEITEK
jgi:hypothetical protein